MTTRAQHKSDPIDFEDLQNSYAARKLRKKTLLSSTYPNVWKYYTHTKKNAILGSLNSNFQVKIKISNGMEKYFFK